MNHPTTTHQIPTTGDAAFSAVTEALALTLLLSAVPAEIRSQCLERCQQIATGSEDKRLLGALQIINDAEVRRALYALFRDGELRKGAARGGKGGRQAGGQKKPGPKAKPARAARQPRVTTNDNGGSDADKPGKTTGEARVSRREDEDVYEGRAGSPDT